MAYTPNSKYMITYKLGKIYENKQEKLLGQVYFISLYHDPSNA